jgi:TPR repeat protein
MKRFVQRLAVMLWCMPVASGAFGQSLEALETAAEQGDAQALTQLGQKYEHAQGVPRDYEKANRYYCKAARSGYIEAQFKLGWVYANGRGVARDDMVAGALFTLAAQQGHEHAARLLEYVKPDPKKNEAASMHAAGSAVGRGRAGAQTVWRSTSWCKSWRHSTRSIPSW